jgi:hypothetical protein
VGLFHPIRVLPGKLELAGHISKDPPQANYQI